MTRFVKPSEVEKYTGLDVDVLRDWRRRKILTIGTLQENGRWAYAVGDVAQIAIANFLKKWRIVSDLSDAFDVAAMAVMYVYADLANDAFLKERLEGVHLIGFFAVNDGDGFQVQALRSVEDIRSFGTPGFGVIDTHLIAAHLRDQLSGLFDHVSEG